MAWRFVIKAQRAGLTAFVSIEITGAYAALHFEFCLLDKSGEFSRSGGALGAVLHRWWRSLDYPSNIAPSLYTRNPLRHLNPLYKSSENPSNPIRAPYQTSIGALSGRYTHKKCPCESRSTGKQGGNINSVPPNQAANQRYPPSGGAYQLILPLPQQFCKRLLGGSFPHIAAICRRYPDTQ